MAEKFCKARGGHLAEVSDEHVWNSTINLLYVRGVQLLWTGMYKVYCMQTIFIAKIQPNWNTFICIIVKNLLNCTRLKKIRIIINNLLENPCK